MTAHAPRQPPKPGPGPQGMPPRRGGAAGAAGPLAAGELVGNRYRIETPIGRGGMGCVYLAGDEQAAGGPRKVALKVHTGSGGTSSLRFLREFRAIQRLDHPFCLKVFDFGTVQGMPFFSMEYVPGGQTFRSLRGAPFERIVAVGARVAAALDHVHALGIVHRDLKPGNVLLAPAAGDAPPQPKVADFGLAVDRSIDAAEDEPLTRAGFVVGTPEYMAPEQVMGQDVDARADLYSLGVLLYEILTGRLPFGGANEPRSAFELMRLKVESAPRPPQFLDPRAEPVAPVLLKLLATDPSDRYPSAADLVQDLTRRFPALVASALAGLPSAPARRAVTVFRPRFVGRETELAELELCLGGLYPGIPPIPGSAAPRTTINAPPVGVAVVRGAPGVGKTRVLDELGRLARTRGIRVIDAGCKPDGQAPYELARAVVDALVRDSRGGVGGFLGDERRLGDAVFGGGPGADGPGGAAARAILSSGGVAALPDPFRAVARLLSARVPQEPAPRGGAAGSGSTPASAGSGAAAAYAAAPATAEGPTATHQLAAGEAQAERGRIRFLHELARAVTTLVEDSPALVILEDVQWIDRASADVFVFSAIEAAVRAREGGERTPRLCLVASLRPQDVRRGHPLAEAIGTLEGAGVPVRNLDLDALAPEDFAALVASALGERQELFEPAPAAAGGEAGAGAGGDAGLSSSAAPAGAGAEAALPGFVRRLREASGGNPLLALEALKELAQRGDLVRGPEGLALDPLASGRTSLRRAAADPGDARTTGLSEEARALLELAAAIGRELDPDLLQAASGKPREAVADRLDELVRLDLLVESPRDPSRLRFVNDAVHASLLAALDEAAQRDAHDRIAAALEARGGDSVEVAEHRLRGAMPGRAVGPLLGASDEAAARFAYADAAHLLARALALLESAPAGTEAVPPAEFAKLLERLGDLRSISLDADGAEEAYRRCLVDAGYPLARGRLHRKIARGRIRAFQHEAAVRSIVRAAQELGVRLPRTRLGVKLRNALDVAALLLAPLLDRLPRLFRPKVDSPLDRERADLLTDMVEAYFFIDLERAFDAMFRRRRLARRLSDAEFSIRTIAGGSAVLATLGLAGRAQRALEAAERAVSSCTDPVGWATVTVFTGVTRFVLGGAREAAAALQDGERLAEGAGDRLLPFYARGMAFEALLVLNDAAGALAAADRHIAQAGAGRVPPYEIYGRAVRARALVRLGRVPEAEEEVRRAGESLRVLGASGLPVAGTYHAEGEVLAALGDLRGALDRLRTAVTVLEGRGPLDVLGIAVLRYAEVAVDLAASGAPPLEPGALGAAVARALRWARTFPVYTSPALRLEGAVAAAASDRPRAERLFQEAVSRAEARGELAHAIDALRARARWRDRFEPGWGEADRERARALEPRP